VNDQRNSKPVQFTHTGISIQRLQLHDLAGTPGVSVGLRYGAPLQVGIGYLA
jgi:hypothetical protein